MWDKCKKVHNVIVLPGLSDDVNNLKLLTSWWQKLGLKVHVLKVGWHDDSVSFEAILEKILLFVDKLGDKGEKVSIIGISAGGSLALNIFMERPEKIDKCVNICGRLRAGKHMYRTLERMSMTSKSFRDSVLLLQQREYQIRYNIRRKIMTVTARFGDELVPADTSFLEGAYNTKIPTFEHIISIVFALTLGSKFIFDFIRR